MNNETARETPRLRHKLFFILTLSTTYLKGRCRYAIKGIIILLWLKRNQLARKTYIRRHVTKAVWRLRSVTYCIAYRSYYTLRESHLDKNFLNIIFYVFYSIFVRVCDHSKNQLNRKIYRWRRSIVMKWNLNWLKKKNPVTFNENSYGEFSPTSRTNKDKHTQTRRGENFKTFRVNFRWICFQIITKKKK